MRSIKAPMDAYLGTGAVEAGGRTGQSSPEQGRRASCHTTTWRGGIHGDGEEARGVQHRAVCRQHRPGLLMQPRAFASKEAVKQSPITFCCRTHDDEAPPTFTAVKAVVDLDDVSSTAKTDLQHCGARRSRRGAGSRGHQANAGKGAGREGRNATVRHIDREHAKGRRGHRRPR